MPLSLLTPWLLGGIALVAVPWFIHRIRRPEREVVPFSSLMFVPVVERRVVERRNLQHILLMLMRMSLLLLLAMAFARPVVERLTAMSPGLAGVGDHLILIDISASMRSDGYLGESISRARELLDARTDADRVGLITFAQSTAVLAPLFGEDADAGQVAVARGRLALIEPTYESTDFHNAIRAALEHFRREQAASDRRRVVHVLTDLQAAGLEEGVRGLVPLDVELRFIAVGGPRSNATVQDAIIARAGSSLIARARIKNWNIPSSDFTVRLVVDGRSIEERVVRIPPGNATLVVDYPGSSVRAAVARDAQRPDGERQRHLRAYRRRELVATRWRRMELRGSRGPPTTASGHARTRALDTR